MRERHLIDISELLQLSIVAENLDVEGGASSILAAPTVETPREAWGVFVRVAAD